MSKRSLVERKYPRAVEILTSMFGFVIKIRGLVTSFTEVIILVIQRLVYIVKRSRFLSLSARLVIKTDDLSSRENGSRDLD